MQLRWRTIVESPYAAHDGLLETLAENINYARRCMHHCLMKGEAPFAPHLLYTQPGVLDDNVPNEREMGVAAGFAWGHFADIHAFYTDRGWSKGMLFAYNRCVRLGLNIEIRAMFSEPKQPPAPVERNLHVIQKDN